MTSPLTFDQFAAARRAEGFDEVLERRWPAHKVLAEHSHPFAVKALVVAGQMWLTVGNNTRSLHEGDEFELARDMPHAERYGAEGATFWVGRRNAAG